MQHSIIFTFEFVNEAVENEEGESQVTTFSLTANFLDPISVGDISTEISKFAAKSEEMFNAVHDFSASDTAHIGYTSYEVEPDEYDILFHGFVAWFYGYGAAEVHVEKGVPVL